jgi:hypothetical protein
MSSIVNETPMQCEYNVFTDRAVGCQFNLHQFIQTNVPSKQIGGPFFPHHTGNAPLADGTPR